MILSNITAVATQSVFSFGVLLCLIGVLACDEGRPETFQQECNPDAGATGCKNPFKCFRVKRQEDDPYRMPICTKPCKKDSDCPSWTYESGDCEGEFQSRCDLGYCQGLCD